MGQKKIRVIQYGLGPIGIETIDPVVNAHPGLTTLTDIPPAYFCR